MKLRGIVKEDLYYVEEGVTEHVRELMTKERLEKVVSKYASKGTKGVYDTEEELFTTEDGDELCIPLEHINIEKVVKKDGGERESKRDNGGV